MFEAAADSGCTIHSFSKPLNDTKVFEDNFLKVESLVSICDLTSKEYVHFRMIQHNFAYFMSVLIIAQALFNYSAF